MSSLSSISTTLHSAPSAVFHLSSPKLPSTKFFYPLKKNKIIRDVGRIVTATGGQDDDLEKLVIRLGKAMAEELKLSVSYKTTKFDRIELEQNLEIVKMHEKDLVEKLKNKQLEVAQLREEIKKIKPETFEY